MNVQPIQSPQENTPIRLIFEQDIRPTRIAELIELLSEVFGEDLNVQTVNTLPPFVGDNRKSA